MSQWHRNHPELAGTDADPWMDVPGHREATSYVKSLQPDVYCRVCESMLEHGEARGICDGCREEWTS